MGEYTVFVSDAARALAEPCFLKQEWNQLLLSGVADWNHRNLWDVDPTIVALRKKATRTEVLLKYCDLRKVWTENLLTRLRRAGCSVFIEDGIATISCDFDQPQWITDARKVYGMDKIRAIFHSFSPLYRIGEIQVAIAEVTTIGFWSERSADHEYRYVVGRVDLSRSPESHIFVKEFYAKRYANWMEETRLYGIACIEKVRAYAEQKEEEDRAAVAKAEDDAVILEAF